MSFEARIDVHAHYVPPFYRAASEESGHGQPDGMPGIPPWNEQLHLDTMDHLSIVRSILSITSPGVFLIPGNNGAARELARKCNEYAGDIKRRWPERFGFWAALPLPDVPGAVEEIHHAIDVLHADGVALETNHHGTYLGDAAFEPVFAELNRRKAKVFIHPTTPCVKSHRSEHGFSPATFLAEYPNPMIEFMFDTARALVNLFLSGTISRCPDITFIIPHAGGALPPVIERFTNFATDILGMQTRLDSQMIKETFSRQFYFDLAGFPFPDQIFGLLRYVGPDRLLYGTDYPYTPAKGVEALAKRMTVGLQEIYPDDVVRNDIYKANAQRLLGFTHP